MQQVRAPEQRTRSLRFDLIGAGLGLAVIGLLAWWTGQPLLFPSVGPSLMLVLDSPSQPSGQTPNILIGHSVGLLVGVLAITVTGLQGAAPVTTDAGTSGTRVLAAALAVSLTTVILHVLDRPHAPAGATTLIVSLGLLDSPSELAAMCASFVLLAGLCVVLRRIRPVFA